jgi:hypothetical protein
MRKNLLMMATAALLMTGGVAAAQLAVPLGQDIQREDTSPSTGSGYGAPYSPRNAPAADESIGVSTDGRTTSSEATTFEDRWSAQAAVPYLPPDAPIPDATTGQAETKPAPASKDLPISPD